jgi:tRNA (guanine-N7-)-methyltransferase
MRYKKVKGADPLNFSSLGGLNPDTIIKINKTNIILEIGCGRGSFISSLSEDNRQITFVAFEKNINAAYQTLKKKINNKLDNLYVINNDVLNAYLYLNNNSVSVIYLNFSDPWPKKKNMKRRLTSNTFINLYYNLLNDNGIIEFKSDVYELYLEFLENITTDFTIIEKSENKEISQYQSEYETKMRAMNKQIYYIKVKKNI